MPALDYTLLAHLYDDYCVAVQDVQLFEDLASQTEGPILELMAGTGRVSLPLLRRGALLTCLDGSLAMLRHLSAKTRAESLPVRLVAGDACRIPISGRFPLVLLPFQGFCELQSEAEQEAALRSVASVLSPTGRFVCTMHSPAARLQTIDGAWHDYPAVARPGGSVQVSIRAGWEPDRRLVVGTQRIRVTPAAAGGQVDDLVLELRFSLPTAARLEALAARAGLRCVELWGDYQRGAYDEQTSPFVIATFVLS
jgi:SAM-dependent methyltransferase